MCEYIILSPLPALVVRCFSCDFTSWPAASSFLIGMLFPTLSSHLMMLLLSDASLVISRILNTFVVFNISPQNIDTATQVSICSNIRTQYKHIQYV